MHGGVQKKQVITMAIESEKELLQLKKRFLELGEKSYQQNIYLFTGFLGMSEQEAFWQAAQAMKHVPFTMWGGSGECERQMVRFGSMEELGYEEQFPICCIGIRPLLEKFADELSHRDFLGALMNLGIDRSTLGDIYIKGKSGYLFCTETISGFIVENLDKVKHTSVKCEILDKLPDIAVREAVSEEHLTSSERIDGIIAKLYNLSRTQVIELFRSKKVYVNGRLNENNSCYLKSGDVASVRGYGKFTYDGISRETRKGKYRIRVRVYR